MNTQTLAALRALSDRTLITKVKELAADERLATAALIAHLAELDRRGLYLAEGCSSLFTYCTEVLRLSEHAAYHRIEAARAARRFPVILEQLAEGAITLTTVRLLAGLLTAENHRAVLAAARHRSKREVEELVARLQPQPAVPAVIRRLPPPRRVLLVPGGSIAGGPSAPAGDGAPVMAEGADPGAEDPPSRAADAPPATEGAGTPGKDGQGGPRCAPGGAQHAQAAAWVLRGPSAVITPLAPERYKMVFTASGATYEKLRLAQRLLRHQIPDGDPAAIFDRALTVLLESLAKRKLAAAAQPRRPQAGEGSGPAGGPPGEGAGRSRHIPAKVRREVWRRDEGRCAFVAADGRRCSERSFLEFHHVVPYSAGGPATVDNIQLRCRAHNGYEARQGSGGRGRAVDPAGGVPSNPADRSGGASSSPGGVSGRGDGASRSGAGASNSVQAELARPHQVTEQPAMRGVGAEAGREAVATERSERSGSLRPRPPT